MGVGRLKTSSAQRAWGGIWTDVPRSLQCECGGVDEERWVRDIRAHRATDHKYPPLARCVSKSCRRRCGRLRCNGARLPAGRARKASLCGRGWRWMFICARAFVLRKARLQSQPWHWKHRFLASNRLVDACSSVSDPWLRPVSRDRGLHASLHAISPWHNPGRARQAISRRFKLGALLALPCEHLAPCFELGSSKLALWGTLAVVRYSKRYICRRGWAQPA